jgi:hypothetical protein
VHRIPQPPVITQEISSTQSARTSVASGGRLSILSEKLSRLSISSNQSGRPSVASDSVLLHKKGESGRLSHSYDDTDTQAVQKYHAYHQRVLIHKLLDLVHHQVNPIPEIFVFNYFLVHQMLLNNLFHLLINHLQQE